MIDLFLRPESKLDLRPGVWGSQILSSDTIALLLVINFHPCTRGQTMLS